ncbi:MAG: BolA family transcriptional regulator [Bradyrhizobiaceae bacterium]|nr:BolA family transcriptional regulator [Bradyrhizobiaceae bacterium]
MAMAGTEIERLIKEAFPEARVIIVDLAGDGDHFAARVTSEAFRGKSRVQQHKMVYDALRGSMDSTLHALALETHVPE